MRWLWPILAWIALAGPASTAYAQSFHTSYAIVIGLDDYDALGLKRLSNAESDARAMRDYLVAQGYHVESRIGRADATKAKVEQAVTTTAASLTDDDRVLFFFSGHGKAQQKEGLDVAYLVLGGGRDANDAASLISTGDVARYSNQLGKARHQLFVFVSCYAGLMGEFQTRSYEPTTFRSEDFLVNDLSKRRVRQYLSAGGKDQQVLDNGPDGLSWFAYFLLRGLEPGEVQQRKSGLITFSELASYVQVMSANPKHTPAFGSLAGHGGGEYLLLTTDKGNPVLPKRKGFTVETLRDLGFLARSDKPETLAPLVDRMREPIDRLFQAWEDRDIDAYLGNFDPAVVQTGRRKDGSTYQRGLPEIEQQRRALFERLADVDVRKYEVMYQGGDEKRAVFGVRYSMDFAFKDGKSLHERGVNECYVVRPHPSESRWVIVRNDDYQARVCEQ